MNEELKVIISAEISKLKKSVSDAKKDIKGFAEQVEKAKKEADKHIKAMGDSIGNGLKSAAKAGATALAGIATALVGTAAATEEYRNNQAKLTTAFEAAGGSAQAATEAYNDLYRVLGDDGQATEAAAHLAKLTTNEKELAEWTTACQGIYATFGDSLPIEGLTEAANETAKVGTVTGSLADALNWAGVSEDEFNEKLAKCNDEAEREKLIRETLTGLYDEAATAYEKNNAGVLAQNEAQAKLTETLAKVGEAIAPVITAFTSFANDALEKVQPYISNLAEKYGPELQTVLEKVGEYASKAVSVVVDNWEIIAAVAGVVAGIATAIGIYNTVAAIKAAMAAAEVTTVWALVAAYAAQAVAVVAALAPYLAIVAAIAAVIAIIVLCVKNWDKIKAKVQEVWESIKAKTTEAVEKIKAKFTEFKEKISSAVEGIKTAITDKFKAAKETALNIFENIYTGIKTKIENAQKTVKSVIDKIKGFFNFEWSLPKIKTPSITISWSQSPAWMAEAAKLVGLQGVPKFAVNWNALGGVFDKPTLFSYGNSLQGIGENGAEAVVPLEKNTQWLDRLAEMLNDKQGNRPIVLKVGKKVFGEIAIECINDITAQTGNLPLVFG